MALGKLKYIDNAERRFGSDTHYWFVKVETKGLGETGEEYWLLTVEEAEKFTLRAADNPEDAPTLSRGVMDLVVNTERKFGSSNDYYAVTVQRPDQSVELWMLTGSELERIRQRVEANAEDIAAHKEGWLANFFD